MPLATDPPARRLAKVKTVSRETTPASAALSARRHRSSSLIARMAGDRKVEKKTERIGLFRQPVGAAQWLSTFS
jgi:hypothetical protein